jgi:hypothetical protein
MANTQLDLRLVVPDADEHEIDEATAQLRRDLLALDVADVRAPTGGPAPDGSRSVDVAQVGALLVSLLATPGLLSSTVLAVRDWLGRRPDSSVELTLDGDTLILSSATAQQQEDLVRAWLDRHG